MLLIARAMLQKADVLLLDEPTARVDSGFEDTIYQAGGNSPRGARTIIPASIAKNISRSMRVYVSVSSLLGGTISVAGPWTAGTFGLVPGPSIILLGVSLFLLSVVIARKNSA